MADSPFRVTDSFTGEQMEFESFDAYMAYMDKKESTADKIAKKNKENAENADKIKEDTFTANNAFGFDKATQDLKTNGDTPSAFSKKDTEKAAEGSGKSLDQVAKEFANKDAYSATGVPLFDLGYTAGRAIKQKIDAAGGIEAFKAAKQEKKTARQKRKKDARAFDKQSARTTDKAKQRKKAGKLSDLMEGKQEVRNLPKNSNPYKPF
jgi:hypothetical protein